MRSEEERNRAGSVPRRYWRLRPRESERTVHPVRSTTTHPRDRKSTPRRLTSRYA